MHVHTRAQTELQKVQGPKAKVMIENPFSLGFAPVVVGFQSFPATESPDLSKLGCLSIAHIQKMQRLHADYHRILLGIKNEKPHQPSLASSWFHEQYVATANVRCSLRLRA